MNALWLSLLLLPLSTCAPAIVDVPPSPSPDLVVAEAACFSGSDCKGAEICIDPRYPVCGNQPVCEGMVLCGCECLAACTATSCEADEVCGTGGCCQPRACSTDAQCGNADSRCVAGQCRRRGTCSFPPP